MVMYKDKNINVVEDKYFFDLKDLIFIDVVVKIVY